MKRLLMLFVMAIACMSFATSASAQLSRLKFLGYKIQSVRPTSLRSITGSATVSVQNDTTSFRMTDISGVVYKSGRAFATGHAADISLPVGQHAVAVSGDAALADGVGFWEAVSSLLGFDSSLYTIDVKMRVIMEDGSSRPVEFKGMSAQALLNNYFRK